MRIRTKNFFALAIALGLTACSSASVSGGDRWSALPHSAICTPTPWANGNLRDPTSDIVFAPVPDELRVQRVTLTHLGGQKLGVAVEFLQSPPTAPIPVPQGGRLTDPPGSVSYGVLIQSHGDREFGHNVLTIDSPRRGLGWQVGSFDNSVGGPGDFEIKHPDSVLRSVETSGNTVNVRLDLEGQDAYFGGEVFKPYVSILVSGVGRRTSMAPQGEFITFETQECPWDQQAASQPTPGTASPGGPPMPPAARPPDNRTPQASDSQYVLPPSGRYRCLVNSGALHEADVACEPSWINGQPGRFAQGPVGAVVTVNDQGVLSWHPGANIGVGSPSDRTSLQYGNTYEINVWTVVSGVDGTRFTNNATGHGMFVSIENVYPF